MRCAYRWMIPLVSKFRRLPDDTSLNSHQCGSTMPSCSSRLIERTRVSMFCLSWTAAASFAFQMSGPDSRTCITG